MIFQVRLLLAMSFGRRLTLGNSFLNLGNGSVIFKNDFGIHTTLFGILWRVGPNKSQPGVMSENVSEMPANASVILGDECGLPVC